MPKPHPLESAPDNPGSLPRDVWVLATIAFCVAVGFGVVVPVLPIFAKSFTESTFKVALVISSFAFMRLVTSPVCAPMITRLGERVVLGAGILIVAASSAACGLAASFWRLQVVRAFGRIGSAMFTVAAMTLLLRTVEPARRGRASAIYSGGFLIGGMAGPAVGALLAAVSITAPFFFYSGTLAIAGMVALALLSCPDGSLARPTPEPMPFAEAIADRRYRAALLTNLAQGWQSIGVRTALVPMFVVETLHRTPSATGTAFAIAAIVQTLALGPSGRAVDTRGRRPMMVFAGVLTGCAAIAMPFSTSIWVLTIILCVYGLGSAAHSTAPTAVLGDVTHGRGGTPVAVFSMVGDLGAIVGPLAAGALDDAYGMPAAFAVGGALLLAGALASALMPATKPAGAAS